ncbi:Zinc finger CCCH domain-containing protein 3 [Sergentomyia squamirostris]
MDEQVLPVKMHKIHINPKFRNAHINPSFFTTPTIPANIHVNPKFLHVPPPPAPAPPCEKFPKTEPIYKTMRKIIRNVPSTSAKTLPSTPSTRLVKIRKHKLIRTSMQPSIVTKRTSLKTLKTPRGKSLYKIDRRNVMTLKMTPQRKLLTSFTPKIVKTSNKKLMRIGTSFISSSPLKLSRISANSSNTISKHRKLHFLNINGVLYKSTANKLQKSTPSSREKCPEKLKSCQDRVLFIRGEKFTVDGNGKRLRKCNSASSALKLTRIHFGGLTYTAKKNGTYERTNSHLSRTHLSIAKQRSITFLANKMVKSNLPCLIYRRLGRCLARERGRCHRVHDPDQVAVCRKFLKGACNDPKCLLSHKAHLSKMPTCKFYLEGCCTASDCPYLHKKLNEKTEICRDFLDGFCKLAEKCSKRHDRICPEIEGKGVCSKKRCPFPHPHQPKKPPIPPGHVEKSEKVRYFLDEHECDDQQVELSAEAREKLTRTLAKVNKMKRNYWINGEEEDTAEGSSESMVKIVPKTAPAIRPPVGDLPSFIPF